MSVGGLLNFDDQHILGNLLQFIVDFVEQFISLVIEVEAVIYITNPQVAVAVFYHGDYFSGGDVRLLAATGHKGRKRITVKRAQAVPRAKPEKTVLAFQRAIDSIAGQPFFQRVVLYYHTILGMDG